LIEKEIHLALRHIQEVESLYAGIQDLNNGKLTHHLIRKQLLEQSLFTVAANMKSRKRDNNDYYTFIHDDINFYYKKAVI